MSRCGLPLLGSETTSNQQKKSSRPASRCLQKPLSQSKNSSSSSQGAYSRQDSKPMSLLAQLTHKRQACRKSSKPPPAIDLDLWYILQPEQLLVWRDELRMPHQGCLDSSTAAQLYVFNTAGAKRGVAGFTRRTQRTLLPVATYPLPEPLRNIGAWPTGQYVEHQQQYYPVFTNVQRQQFLVEDGVAQVLTTAHQQQVRRLVLSPHDTLLLKALVEEWQGEEEEEEEAADGQQLC